MKTITFVKEGNFALGVKIEDRVLDVEAALGIFGGNCPRTDMELIQGGRAAITELESLAHKAQTTEEIWLNEDNIVWGPSVTRPNKMICVGLNYKKHADETNSPYPEVPILFNKFNNTLTGNLHNIAIPRVTEKMDYEAELVIVIGKVAKYVSAVQALDYVYGYTIVNDLSARDLQTRTQQWLLGKTCDDFSPLGPYLVSGDEVGDPNQLGIRTTVNGEVRQQSNTSDMIFHCSEIVSYISQHMTLVPGDIILTGTPEGVVLGKPLDEQIYLQPGDVVTIEIDKLGQLTNQFIAENSDQRSEWRK